MDARPRLQTTTPILMVAELARSIDFYVTKLGFASPRIFGEPPSFAMLYRSGLELMLNSTKGPAGVRPNGPTGVWDVYVGVADVAAEIAVLASAGVTPDIGPTDREYNMREIEVVDPDGHRWCFGQDITWENAERWAALLDVGTAKLRLVLKLRHDGEVRAVLDSLDQAAMNIPVDAITLDAGILIFAIQSFAASFNGIATGVGEYSGQWTQGGRSWPLVFRKGV